MGALPLALCLSLTEKLLQEAQAAPDDCPYRDPFHWAGFRVMGGPF